MDRREAPLVLVIFGITGDLAQRKLLPALYHLEQAGGLPPRLHIAGISRRDVDLGEVYGKLGDFIGDETVDDAIIQTLIEKTEMIQMDLVDRSAYENLYTHLQSVEDALGHGAGRLYYLSIPPQVFSPIIRLLGETGHNAPFPGSSDAPRLLIEKPFGYDVASAEELIDTIGEHFGEGQVYRIDHYVAKETVQNILTFRFQNALFDSVWDGRHIRRITVTAYEKLDIEGRVGFYDQTGALRDLIQSHLLQLLAITTLDRPERMDSDGIHAQKLALLEAIPPIAPDKVATDALRGQYDGYRSEVDNPETTTETFARIHLRIDNDTWRGTDFTLQTGKALDDKRTEICVEFDSSRPPDEAPNRLYFRIQPSEGITLQLQAKTPGIDSRTDTVNMAFDYATAFDSRSLEAYERVIIDAMRGDQTLFASSAEVMAAWRIVENVISQWSHNDDGLITYPKGSAADSIAP